MPKKSDECFTTPLYLEKYVGTKRTVLEASIELGVSDTHVARCLAGKSKTSKALELAARYLYERSMGNNIREDVAVMTFPKSVRAVLETVVTAHGGRFQVIQ